MLGLMKRIWKAWKRVALGLITFQNGVFLMVVFVFGIGPVALFRKLSRKKLLDTTSAPAEGWSTAGTWWEPLPSRKVDANSAQRPY